MIVAGLKYINGIHFPGVQLYPGRCLIGTKRFGLMRIGTRGWLRFGSRGLIWINRRIRLHRFKDQHGR